MEDKLNRTLEIGDYVVAPARWGRDIILGKITKFTKCYVTIDNSRRCERCSVIKVNEIMPKVNKTKKKKLQQESDEALANI